MVRPDYCAVDHLQTGVAATAVVQCFKQQLPEARQRPAAKLAIHARPFTKMLMEITPRDTPSAQSRKYHQEQAGDLSERRPLRGPRSITNGSRQAQSSSLNQTTDHGSLLAKATWKQKYTL